RLEHMRVFIYEYTSSGGMTDKPAASSLQAEGWAMLTAVLHDFERVPGVETVTLLGPQHTYHGKTRVFQSEGQDCTAFRKLAGQADYTLLIAPEFHHILLERCRWVLDERSRLLGPSPDAVALTGDKLALAHHLIRCSLPTPVTRVYEEGALPPFDRFPLVCKPRDGAGSQATWLIKTIEEFRAHARDAAAEGSAIIVQP